MKYLFESSFDLHPLGPWHCRVGQAISIVPAAGEVYTLLVQELEGLCHHLHRIVSQRRGVLQEDTQEHTLLSLCTSPNLHLRDQIHTHTHTHTHTNTHPPPYPRGLMGVGVKCMCVGGLRKNDREGEKERGRKGEGKKARGRERDT